jgi:hypothetical protein
VSGGGRRLPAAVVVAAVAVAVAVVGSYFLPWARSGQVDRSAWALARTVDLLGLADHVWLRALLVAFWFSPLLVGVAWTAAALGGRRVAGVAVAAVGGIAVAAAVVVVRAGGVEPAPGAWIGIVLGTSALAGGAVLAMTARADG